MRRLIVRLVALCVLSWLAAGCMPAEPPRAGASEITIVVIGKSINPYWSNVQKGAEAAGRQLGAKTLVWVPPKEDAAAQIETMETYIAQGVTGIAIAPSDPEALERVMRQAAAAGIIVTTLDTPPVAGSVALAYIGTDNYRAGEIAGKTLAALLPQGGKVGIMRGSDTALNALQRTEGFLSAIESTSIKPLAAVNDEADVAASLQLTSALLVEHPDLAGAYGVYAYNGMTWATAIKEAGAAGRIRVVCFDANSDTVNGIVQGVLDATVAQREYDMGYKSVQLIKLVAEKGAKAALTEMGAVDGIIDTGVDVVTAANLQAYEAALDAKGIPHEWRAP